MKYVVAAVIEKEGRILIAQRKIGSHLERKWEFPGGKVEEGETPEKALRRELHEEFGITAEIGELFCDTYFDYGDVSIKLSAYRVESFLGDFILREHEKIEWIEPNCCQLYDMADADIPVVNKLLEMHRPEAKM